MTKRKFDLYNDYRGLKSYKDRIWVQFLRDLRDLILTEAHNSRLTVHLGSIKMYRDLKRLYWWPTMKIDVANFFEKCHICAQVKAEHQKLYGSLRQLENPQWKWDHINAEKVEIAREKLKAAKDGQKMYADPCRRSMTFDVGDRVYLKVSPWKGSRRRKSEISRRVD
ncbi:uncharacterized protein [Rutidosis leptorrhynchoides]|uniref:uncharacterized protein n=1 Tax=Rutidosis leptorrhynchoides TaxID=125765 RepID=UPI003A99F66D